MFCDDQVGSRILHARAGLRLSQAELADMVGIAAAQLYRYESGRVLPRPSTVGKLASALGVAVAWLARGELPMEPEGGRDDIAPLPKGGVIENFEVPVETYEWLKKRAASNNRTVEMEINELIIDFAKSHAARPVPNANSADTSKLENPTHGRARRRASK